ncbi:MAG: DUF2147 domain-containing protein [Rhodobacteraceae bacterium]|nr:DUF2147 domain-containing protein [Paracoccaceae bacterium]
MKRVLAAAFLAVLAGPALAADPVEGIWQTKPDDNGNFGYVRIAPCGERFCGVLIRAFGGDGQPMESDNIGKRIVWDMAPQGGGAYGDGKVWSPDRDKTYNSKMELQGDQLAVSGCVLFVCRDGGTWTRVE